MRFLLSFYLVIYSVPFEIYRVENDAKKVFSSWNEIYTTLDHRNAKQIVPIYIYFLHRIILKTIKELNQGHKTGLVSVNICSVEGNSAGIFVSKVSPGIFVIKERWKPIIFGRQERRIKLSFWVR